MALEDEYTVTELRSSGISICQNLLLPRMSGQLLVLQYLHVQLSRGIDMRQLGDRVSMIQETQCVTRTASTLMLSLLSSSSGHT